VKVPAGKHCGFVQFVRKADAERAIEKMQGFPVGGSRIRLSWGRSQCKFLRIVFAEHLSPIIIFSDKAAQAAAQAAQAAALQAQYQAQLSAPAGASVTPEQAMELLQKFGIQGFFDKSGSAAGSDGRVVDGSPVGAFAKGNNGGITAEEQMRLGVPTSQDDYDGYSSTGLGRQLGLMPVRQNRMQTLSNFSPFSPDPNLYTMDRQRKDSTLFSRPELLPYSSKNLSPGFGSSSQDFKVVGSMNGKSSPPSIRPLSGSRYGSFLDGSAPPFQMNQTPARPEGSISRPSSGQTTTSGGRGAGSYEIAEQDFIQDLNGTLASLDLDHTHEQWKSPAGNGEDPSGRIAQQFQVGTASQARTPSP
jgi:RNA recognition motif-containing protein